MKKLIVILLISIFINMVPAIANDVICPINKAVAIITVTRVNCPIAIITVNRS